MASKRAHGLWERMACLISLASWRMNGLIWPADKSELYFFIPIDSISASSCFFQTYIFFFPYSFFTSRLSFINLAPGWKSFLIFELSTTQALSVTIYTVVSLCLLPQLNMYLILPTPLTCWKDLCGPQWSGDRFLVPRNIYEYVISFDCSQG